MICKKCGKENEEDMSFCTSCGASLQETKIQKTAGGIQMKLRAFWEKITSAVSKTGEIRLNETLCLSCIFYAVLFRLLGFMFAGVLITLVNIFLIITVYKKEKKIEKNMILLSAVVLLLGIIL